MVAALGIGRFAYTPLLPEMVAAYGWDFAQAGDLASVNFLGYLIGALLARAAAESRLIHVWIACSLMASAGTTYLGAEATSYVAWLAVRAASGIASAYCLVTVTTLVMRALAQSGPGAAKWDSVHFSGVGIGMVLSILVVANPALVATHWANLGALSALLLAIAWFLLGRIRAPVAAARTAAANVVEDSRALWGLIVGYGLFGFGYVVSATFIVAIADVHPDLGEIKPMQVWLVAGCALIPSVPVWVLCAERIGLMRTLQIAYLLEAVGVLLTVFGGSVWLLFAGAVCLGGTFAAITALGLSAAGRIAPSRAAFAISTMTVAFAVGQLLGPAVAGRMADAFGSFVWPSALACALLVIAALLVSSREPESG